MERKIDGLTRHKYICASPREVLFPGAGNLKIIPGQPEEICACDEPERAS